MITDYQAEKVLRNLFNGNAISNPTKYYVALSTTTPNANGTGFTEPSGMGYIRQGLTRGTTDFNTYTNGKISNKTVVTFPESTGTWGLITHFGLYDAEASGNLLYYGRLDRDRLIDSESILIFPSNTLTIDMV